MITIEFQDLLADCIDFSQRLIQTPSMPGEEENLAAMIINEMQKLDFDTATLDDMGNVTGRIYGADRDLGAIVLNSHLDHVDPGEPNLWSVPPYSATISDGYIIGRGACDIKGPLAVQIYSMAALRRANRAPRRDIVFSGVVEEEVGGAGAMHWAENVDFPIDIIVLGEPSSNNLSLGHRGILQMWVTFLGRSVHASVPESGKNPNYALVEFLSKLRQEADTLSSHEQLGKTTVTPTIIEVDTVSMNVMPAWTRVLLDIRTASESPNSITKFVKNVAGGLNCQVSDAWARQPGTPLPDSDELIYGYYTPDNDYSVTRMRELVAIGMGWEPELISYKFATDGRHLLSIGAPIVGFSPGEEQLAHTVKERIEISMMADSLKGHTSLLSEF
jgi:putative selenium metabolism hydrolase